MSDFWSQRTVVVTGGRGFLGTHTANLLRGRGTLAAVALGRSDYDLRRIDAVERMFTVHRPDVVLHLAGLVGGIGANQQRPGEFFFDNISMGANILEVARRARVEKVVLIGSVCSYPSEAHVPFREDDLWDGYPDETNAAYGVAKRALLAQAQAYRAQYGLRSIYLVPTNLYGPGDEFDPDLSHVLPAIIRKCIEARDVGASEIVLWGDGTPTREFLYVEDAAEAIVKAAEQYDGPAPVNLGSGAEITIRDLAALVAQLTRFSGRIVWDTQRPNGYPRRRLDRTRELELLGVRPQVALREGLARTIAWYEAHHSAHSIDASLEAGLDATDTSPSAY